MTNLFQVYYSGIPVGIIIGFTSYFLGYAVGGFFRIVQVGTD